MTGAPLSRGQVIERLRRTEPEIRKLGVRRLGLFGSVLRGEARPDSDVDILVEFAPSAKSFDRLLRLCSLLEERPERHVEVVTTEALSPFLRLRILAAAEDILLPPPFYLLDILLKADYLLGQH